MFVVSLYSQLLLIVPVFKSRFSRSLLKTGRPTVFNSHIDLLLVVRRPSHCKDLQGLT